MSSISKLGRKIIDARRAKGLTQAELADLTGVSRASISLYESGNGHPSYKVLGKLSQALGILFAHSAEMASDESAATQGSAISTEPQTNLMEVHLMQSQLSIQSEHIASLQEQVKRLEAQVDLLIRMVGDSRK